MDNEKTLELIQTKVEDVDSVISDPFCTGGCLNDTVTLFARNETESCSVDFPVCQHAANAIHKLESFCKPSRFGYGKQSVMDLSYRNALELASPDVTSSFNPAEHGILPCIQQLLMPSSPWIVAKFYKLNIYQVNGHFKSHVDTPRPGVFGSLVVALPSAFEGGELVVRHNGKETSFDWANELLTKKTSIHWAAFYSNCEHEVLPVTSGIRITLTYNLYSAADPLPMNELVLDEQKVVSKLQELASLFPKGVNIGFPCVHAYSLGSAKPQSDPLQFLKGRDAVVFRSIQAIKGIDVSFKSVFDVEDIHCESKRPRLVRGEYIDDRYPNLFISDYYPSSVISSCLQIDSDGNDDELKAFMSEDLGATVANKIVWCKGPPTRFPTKAAMPIMYGNEATTSSIYAAGVIIMHVRSSVE